MAIGDTVGNITLLNAQLRLQMTFICPNCAFVNTTPLITRPIAAIGAIFTAYGGMPCANCTKQMFFTVTDGGLSISGQQVQA